MILADKITEERKKLGLSQEELAERLSVSRQAVSKWENAESVPDLQRIIAMSQIFCVSTDYLLKDNEDRKEEKTAESENSGILRRVSMEEAADFLCMRESWSAPFALAVSICILSPLLLFLLLGLAESSFIAENIALVLGLPALFLFVAAAVLLFVKYSLCNQKFEYLEKEVFETAYGVSGMVKKKKDEYKALYSRHFSLALVILILSPLPLLFTAVLCTSSSCILYALAFLFAAVAVGVYLIVHVTMVKDSYDILLEEGDYRREEKKKSASLSIFSSLYWTLSLSVYLAWSFLCGRWNLTWLVWPVAGVLYAPLAAALNLVTAKCEKEGK